MSLAEGVRFSEFGIVWAFIVAAGLFFLLKGIDRLGKFLLKSEALRDRFHRVFPIVEAAAWLLFAGWSARLVFSERLYADATVLLISLTVLLWFSWFAAKDWVAGLTLKVRDGFEAGQYLKIGEHAGRIRHAGYLALDLEQEDGRLVKIPYSRMMGEVHWQKSSAAAGDHLRLDLELPKDRPPSEAVRQLRLAILSSPWAALNKEPRIELVKDTEQKYVFEVYLYSQGRDRTQQLAEDVKRAAAMLSE